MLKKHGKLFILGFSLLAFVACDRADDAVEPEENELITTVSLKFTEQGTTNTQTFTYRDTDGDGGAAPSRFDNVALKPNATYRLDVEFLDESKNPAKNITTEVAEEADEHLVIYTPSPAALLTYTATDKDSKNLPIGLTGTARTGAAGTGKLRVQLRHQPGTKNGTTQPGSDDVNLEFNLTVAQ